MRRAAETLTLAVGLVGWLCAAGCHRVPRPGDPLEELTAVQRNRFERGRTEFERVFTPETGLGPLFNANACAECHESPVAGGPCDEVEVHVSAFLSDGASCDPLVLKGGPIIQQDVTPAPASARCFRSPAAGPWSAALYACEGSRGPVPGLCEAARVPEENPPGIVQRLSSPRARRLKRLDRLALACPAVSTTESDRTGPAGTTGHLRGRQRNTGAGSYGGSSRNRDRSPASGDCLTF